MSQELCTAFVYSAGCRCVETATRFFLRTGKIQSWAHSPFPSASRCDKHAASLIPGYYGEISFEEFLILQVLEG